MKLLRISAKGFPLFKEDFDVSFVATQRVSEEDKDNLYRLFSNVYLNPTGAFVGINASGKTLTLNLITLAICLVNSKPLNNNWFGVHKKVLGDAQNAVITVYFFSEKNDEICRLETTIAKGKDGYFIKEESFKTKRTSCVKSRKTLFDFDSLSNEKRRSELVNKEFLPDDVSIVISYNKRSEDWLYVTNSFQLTESNILSTSFDCNFMFEKGEEPETLEISKSLVSFLDPSTEYLKIEKKDNAKIIRLKFIRQKELVFDDTIRLIWYLSSGTRRGIAFFTVALETIQHGGVMLVDEIENHFNREIVATLIRFFMDTRINKKGAVLFFSTHYSELLDEYCRNDSIFITRNQNGITAENLSNILTRNDIKKSEAYQSGFLGGTAPRYEAYMQLKKSFQAEYGERSE